MDYKFLISSLLLLLMQDLFANEIVNQAIMDSIITKADAVILTRENTFRITSINEGVYDCKQRILIKNEKGEKYCAQTVSGSEYVAIDDLEARITDLAGNTIVELEAEDIKDAALSPEYILYSDRILKYFRLTHHTYPYIFEFSYRLEISSLFLWPSWYPQADIPVISASYRLIMEELVRYRVFSIGRDISFEANILEGDSTFLWQILNIPPRVKEDYLAPEDYTQLAVLFAPDQFSIDGYHGSFNSWASMGKWFYRLFSDRLMLSNESILDIQSLMKDTYTTKEKIEILYNYLQTKTRYVAIKLGIGRWQPHTAQSVYNHQYGDCIDLTTLMIAMLKIADIQAYPALTLTRDEGIVYKEFPSNQFNHCIAFIPQQNDTIWLECTADFISVGDLPYSVEDVNTLVVKEKEGEIVCTPKSTSLMNRWHSTLTGEILSDGSLQFTSRINTSGNQKIYFVQLFGYSDRKEETISLQKRLGRYNSNLSIDSYAIVKEKLQGSIFTLETIGEFKKFVSLRGKRIFLNPNILNRETAQDIPDESVRKYPLYLRYPYIDTDSVKIKIPPGYEFEAGPECKNIDTPFARFFTDYKYVNNEFVYLRIFEQKENNISVARFEEYKNFLKKIVEADNSKFVFKRIM